jgi:hypothetical protein
VSEQAGSESFGHHGIEWFGDSGPAKRDTGMVELPLAHENAVRRGGENPVATADSCENQERSIDQCFGRVIC